MEIISITIPDHWPKNPKINVSMSLEEYNNLMIAYVNILKTNEYNEGYSDAYDQLHREFNLTPKEETE